MKMNNTKKISSLLSILLTFFFAPILPLSLAQTTTTSSSSSSYGCIDLTQYATSTDGGYNMDILMNGGQIPNNAPVFFDIPSQFVTSYEELDYCLQNITIPSYVGNNNCNVYKSQQCWLAVGLFAGDTTTHDSSTTDSCINSDTGDTNGCYECTCTGSSMRSGIANENESISGCGLQTDTRWGMSCRDVTNGRYNWLENDTRIGSNYSNVKVSICPSNVANCNICQGGGLHPSFRIGVQWISNLQEQCYDHPFGSSSSSCTDGLSTSSIIGIVVGSVLLLGVLSIFFFFYLFNNNKRRNNSRSNSLLSRQTSNNNTTTKKSTKTNNNGDIIPPPVTTTASTIYVPIVDESSMKTDEDSN